jgi:signal transduction histidine kinase/ligand-binding sensor domain-containing protein/CheY-like chemotaxis protein
VSSVVLTTHPMGPSPRLALAVCLALAPAAARALDPARALSQYGHDAWEIEHGLPQNTVYAIAQTRDRYLWFGTAEGLVRFDGVAFTVVDRRHRPEMTNNVVGALAADRDGALWVGTDGGLLRLEGDHLERVDADGLRAQRITALHVDGKGQVWAGAWGSGLWRRAGGSWSRIPAPPELGLHRVRDFADAPDGSLWVASEGGGLTRLAGDAPAETLGARSGLGTDRVRSVAVAADGTVWIGTADSGLKRRAKGGAVEDVGALAPLGVYAVHVDARDMTWAAVMGGGTVRVRDGRLERFTTTLGLTDDSVWTLAEDADGSLWMGTLAGGLNRLRDGRFLPFGPREGLSGESTRALAEDRSGAVWVGTEGGGLSRIRDGAVDLTWEGGPALVNRRIYSIVEDGEGALWTGGFSDSLDRLQDGRISHFKAPPGGLANGVHTILPARGGGLWLGTFRDGLYRFRPGAVEGGRVEGTVTPWTRREGLSSDDVISLLEDRQGALWIGTAGGGLNRLHNGKVETLSTRNGFPSDFVYALHEDASGVLWAGTFGGGLVRRAPDGSLFVVGTRHGLFDDVVYGLLDDGLGYFWMTSNRGIFRVSRAALEDLAAGRVERVESTVYGLPDGMRSVECNAGGQPVLRSRDGLLWFATVRGVVRVDPRRLEPATAPLPLRLERVTIDGRSHPTTGRLHLPAGVERLEFAYTAPAFRAPGRVLFRHRLRGLDHDWVEAGTRRVAFYSHVPHGDYTFEVLASNEDGVWSTTPVALQVDVAPRFRETAAFYLLVSALAMGLVLGAHRLRVRRMEAHQLELRRLVQERTSELRRSEARAMEAREEAVTANQAKSAFLARMSHELRTPLNVILGFLQLMQADAQRSPDEHQQLGIMRRSGEHLLRLINDVLSLARIESGRLTLDERPFPVRALLHEVQDMFRLAASRKGLALNLHVAPGLPELVRGDDGKLRQVLINLVGNAVKFTERGHVTLDATWRDGRGVFVVEDTGPGVAAGEHKDVFEAFTQTESGRRSGEGTGLGLAISRSFVTTMGGELVLEPESGAGARFRVEVPLAPVDGHAPEQLPVRFRLAPGEPTRRMLVVDDSEDNRLLLRSLLGRMGFEVLEAATGAEGLVTWEASQPDLVWMDLRMDVMDGYEAAREIRRREQGRGRRTAIVALTASALEEEHGAVLAAGCDEIILKPYTEAQIWQAVARHLGVRFLSEPATPPAAKAPATVDSLGHLPADWVSELHVAVERADVEAAERVVARIREQDAAAADSLQGMLRDYKFDELLALTAPS